MTENGTLESFLIEVASFLQPLANAATRPPVPQGVFDLAASAGLDLNQILVDATPVTDFAIAFSAIYATLQPISKSGEIRPDQLSKVLDSIRIIFDRLTDLDNLQVRQNTDPEYARIGQRLIEYLLFNYLRQHRPAIYNFFLLFGVISLGNAKRRELPKFDLTRISTLFKDPSILLSSEYGWGSSNFNSHLFLTRLQALGWNIGFPSVFHYPEESIATMLGANKNRDYSDPQLRVPIAVVERGEVSGQVGFALLPVLSPASSGSGLAIVPFGAGSVTESISLGDQWQFVVEVSANAVVSYGLVISADDIKLIGLDQGSLPTALTVRTAIERLTLSSQNTVLISQSDQLRLEIGTVGLQLGFSSAGETELFVELPIRNAKLVVDTAEKDGFLQKILPKDGIQIDFDLAVGWSNKKGLYLRGGAGLETTLPINKNLFDVLLINSVYLAILAKESGISLAAATSVTLKMGPVVVAIEQMGLKANISFPERGGNLGPVNLEIGFKPPKGAGLVIDASAVVGAGFLEFDPDNAMYSGFVYLEIVKKISVTAVGLITTRMPDGSPGFSLLALIAVQFSPGIQLGYGFTLNGLGGLLGINRTAKVDILRNGLRNGTLGSILFPSDPKQNIARIISDLKAVFPPAKDRFVFGPMVILGWGPNELIKLELGIILELPDPVRLLILGRLSLKLPDDKNPVVRLKLDSLGVIEFATGDVSLDAVLYDSEIKGFTITGEMALRANFGASPGFLLSVGGFHPAFKAPPGFPTLQRVAISLATGDNPQLRLAAYMAITTNTVQFGGALEIQAKIGDSFSVEGQFSFDALIQFDPFGLIVSLGAMIAVKSGKTVLLCIKLDLNLTGPTPWHAWGEAVFQILLINFRCPIDIKSGEEQLTEPPSPVNILPMIIAALQEPTNWSTQLPPEEHPLVVFREQAKGSGIFVHPLAKLQVSQRVAPLNKAIYKYGNAPLENGIQTFSLTIVGATGTPEYIKDWFAPAHFDEMTDDEKIAADSFEQNDAGIRFTQGGYRCGAAIIENNMEYQIETLGDATDHPFVRGNSNGIAGETTSSKLYQASRITNDFLEQVACLGAVGQSLLRKTGTAKYQNTLVQDISKPVFTVKPRRFILVGDAINSVNSDVLARNLVPRASTVETESKIASHENAIDAEKIDVLESYTDALELRKKIQAISPKKRTRLKIIPF